MHLTVFADGGSRGNPGPAAAGAVVCDSTGKVLARIKSDLGVGTNNRAEYAGVYLGVQRAIALGATQLSLRLDSKLVVEQLMGRWRVRDAELQKAHAKTLTLLGKVPKWEAAHIPRDQNSAADALVNEILDALCGPKRQPPWLAKKSFR
jgi:probable phosphoglycerate mutase